MTDRWTHMLADLRAHFAPDADVRDVERYLAAHGLAPHEIDELLSRFVADVAAGASLPPARDRVRVKVPRASLRVQGPHERGRFTAEAWGFLLMLHEVSATRPDWFEGLVQRALQLADGPVTLPDVRALADELGVAAAALHADHTLVH